MKKLRMVTNWHVYDQSRQKLFYTAAVTKNFSMQESDHSDDDDNDDDDDNCKHDVDSSR